MKKHFFIILTVLLPLTATLGQSLEYRLLPDSTITPASSGIPTGTAQPLTGTFTWVSTPSGIIDCDAFNITALNFKSRSYRFTLASGSQPDNTTMVGTDGWTELNAYVDLAKSSTNPWFLGSYGNGSYTGPATAPTRLILGSIGLYSPDGPNDALVYIDAELTDVPSTNPYPNILTISAIAESQQPTNAQSNGSTIPNPLKSRVDNKQILVWLAQDEYTEGNYGAPVFPAGTQLAIDGPDILVEDQTGAVLVNASDIFYLQDGTNNVFSGKLRPDNAAYNPTGKELHYFRLNFDDTAVPGGVGLQFNLQGLMTTTFNDTKPAAYTFNRTATGKAPNAAGDGNLNGVPCVLTGSIDTQQKIELVH